MALTLTNLKQRVSLALGGNPDSRISKQQIVNEAGRFMVTQCHPWWFTLRPPTTLDLTASQAFVTFPADFGALLNIRATNSLTREFELTTLDAVEYQRTNTVTGTTAHYYGAIVWATQTNTTSNQGRPRLEIWPTPSANESAAFRLTYRAGWVELSNAASVPNIPLEYERLLCMFIDAYARYYDDDDWGWIDHVLASPEYALLMRSDGRTQANLGHIEGGATRQVGRWRVPYTTVTHPT
jgi:hypothetical protein